MRYVGQDLLIYCRTSYQDAEFSLDQNDLILRQKFVGPGAPFSGVFHCLNRACLFSLYTGDKFRCRVQFGVKLLLNFELSRTQSKLYSLIVILFSASLGRSSLVASKF